MKIPLATRSTIYFQIISVVSGGFLALAANAATPTPTLTIGATPPEGATILFDGSNQDAWASQMNRQWEQIDGPADWKITPEGWLEVVPGTGSLISKAHFGDFKMHLEFRLPEDDINGGVFIMARYEFGIKASKEGGSECGAFENLKKKIDPNTIADAEPNEWQSVDIDFSAPRFDANGALIENARATVLFNGIVIHDNVELGPRKGAAKRLGDAPEGPLMLQEHGSAYQFRNIWVLDRTAPGE